MLKRIAKIALVLLVLTLIITTIACSKRAPGSRYYNKGDGYSFLFPKEWKEREKYMGSSVFVTCPLDGDDDKFQENINIVVEDVAYDATLEDFSFHHGKMRQSILANLHTLKSGIVKIDDVPAKWDEIEHSNGPLKFRILTYMAVNDGKGFIISCISESKNYKKYQDAFKKMISSFTFDE